MQETRTLFYSSNTTIQYNKNYSRNNLSQKTIPSQITKMTIKKQTQNKFMKIITCPLKVLTKARDFYVKTMVGCAGSTGPGVDYPIGQYSSLPRSFSASSTRNSSVDDEDTRELIRAASARTLGERRVVDGSVNLMVREPKRLPKSSSVMGRIDEESTCEFEFGEGDVGGVGKLYPRRSRSYAVGNRNLVF